jgi:hypothetical protein
MTAADIPDRPEHPHHRVTADNPIENVADDVLERADGATTFARYTLSLNASRGLVIGVLGAWGSGKTSYINLARIAFERANVQVLDFNPWMFSGAEQLIEAFFREVSSQLKLRPGLAEVGQQLEAYGELLSGLGWVPLVGPWLDRGRAIIKLVGSGLTRRRGGLHSQKQKVEIALASLSSPIIVVLDDIDRLTTTEIQHVFRLVRLTASFPNIIYLLAFDRTRVELALGESGVSGRLYLEKILQLTVDLPATSPALLGQHLLSAIEAALAGVENTGPFDEDAWPDYFHEIIRPLVGSMRDVRRYTLALRGTVVSLQGQVALADLMSLEAIRVFLPDVFAELHPTLEALTSTESYGSQDEDSARAKADIEALISRSGNRADIVRAMVRRLFPAAERHLSNTHYGTEWQPQWLRARRVAHEEILRLYLERLAGEDLRAFTSAERAWRLMSDRNALDAYLRSLELARLEKVIGALESYEDDYKSEHVVPGVVVLLNLLPLIPDRPRGMFEFGSLVTVTRVTYRLLRSLKDPEVIERAVREILPQLHSLSAKWEVVSDVGYQKDVGHKLISSSAAELLEAEWRSEVRLAPVEELEREPQLLRVLLVARRGTRPGEEAVTVPRASAITSRLLADARSDTLSQTMGKRAVRREPRLAWDALVSVFGSEKVLLERLDELRETGLVVPDNLWALVARYREGWRPES